MRIKRPSIDRRSLFGAVAVGTVGMGDASSAEPARGGADVAVLSNGEALRKARLRGSVQLVELQDRAGARYRRGGVESPFLPALVTEDGTRWQLEPSGRLDVRHFGAMGNGITDDTRAIQAAIDCAIYQAGCPTTVFFPAGRYRTSDTLHVGYGNRWATLVLEGEIHTHQSGRECLHSLVEPAFADRPCLNVQGGRRVRLRRLTLRGRNHTYLLEAYETFSDRTNRSLWRGADLPISVDSRTAPYAGIAIDAYAGPPPHLAYPSVSYPAFTGITSQYGKNFSSMTTIEECEVNGFGVGILVQPGHVPDASNGDFLTIRDCDFSYNLTGMALTQSDARCNNIENCRIHFCHTALDGVGFGNGHGNWIGTIVGSSFDNVTRLLDIDVAGHPPQWGGSPVFIGCYGESMYSLGVFQRADAPHPGTVTFEHCKFQFSVKGQEFSPRALLIGPTGRAVFRACIFMGGFGLHHFDCSVDLENVDALQLLAAGAFDLSATSGRVATAFTRGFLASGGSRVCLRSTGRAPGFDIGAFPIFEAGTNGAEAALLPWWARRVHDDVGSFDVPNASAFTINRSAMPLREVAWNGSEVSFSLNRKALVAVGGSVPIEIFLAPGDLVDDEAHLYYVRAIEKQDADAIRVCIRRVTGLRKAGADAERGMRLSPSHRRDQMGGFDTDGVLVADRGVLRILSARRYYPAVRQARLVGVKSTTRLQLCDPMSRDLSVRAHSVRTGDFVQLSSDWRLRPAERLRRIAAVDLDGGVLTLDEPLMISVDGPCPTFVRTI